LDGRGGEKGGLQHCFGDLPSPQNVTSILVRNFDEFKRVGLGV